MSCATCTHLRDRLAQLHVTIAEGCLVLRDAVQAEDWPAAEQLARETAAHQAEVADLYGELGAHVEGAHPEEEA